MISSRFTPILFILILSIIMSCVVSGISTFSTISVMGDFFESWMVAWGRSWVVAFPTMLIVAPLSRKLVEKITTNTS